MSRGSLTSQSTRSLARIGPDIAIATRLKMQTSAAISMYAALTRAFRESNGLKQLKRPKGRGKNTRDHGHENHDGHGSTETWCHAPTLNRQVYSDHVTNAPSEINNDSTAILPVRIGTVIAGALLIYCAFTQPIAPSDVDGVWWFGAALVASISGVLGLFFLQWREKRMQRRSA